MNNCLIIILSTILLTPTFAQERGTYQADSIYNRNNVKLRKWYSGKNKKLGVITYYDQEGRLTKYQVKMNLGATDRTTHYQYDIYGRLVNIVDSTKNGEPDKSEIKRLKKMGLNPNMLLGNVKNKPSLELSKYELFYENDELIKIIKYNPDESLNMIDYLKSGGLIQKREWYRKGELYRVSTTEYLIPNHKKKFYGWEITSGSKSDWDYRFKYEIENAVVQSYVRFDGGEEKETVQYFYDDSGLLLRTEGYVLEQFEYEYYE